MTRYAQYIMLYITAFITCLLVSSSAFSAQSGVVSTNNVKASLISEHKAVVPGQTFSVILRIDIRDGWHTYWRNPGDSGQATSIKWQLPSGVSAGNIEWPYPERQYIGPVANYGYHGIALHRIQFSLKDSWPIGEALTLKANAKWLVCEEECIPEQGSFELTLKTSTVEEVAEDNLIDFARAESILPTKLDVSSSYQYTSDGKIRFEFSPVSEITKGTELEYFPYEWGVLQPPAKQTVIIEPSFAAITSLKSDLTFSTNLLGLLVVSDDQGEKKAYEVESSFGPLVLNSKLIAADANTSISLFGALLFAFIGGIILNLMPCVFPVLSMKALSIVSHASESHAVIKRHGVVYTLGILSSFIILGVTLLIIQMSGEQIGWGFQLQSPLFVSVIVVVLFVLGLSLSGFVELGSSLMGAGSGLANQSGYRGSFFTGMLAVIVATPCTAPFMGPAIGFALTQSPLVTLLVLLALGLGLALPYLLLCYFPVFSRYLPKPGLWMQKLQQFLAFPMYATAAWFVWVLGLQAGIDLVFALLITCILIALAIWLWQIASTSLSVWGSISKLVAILLIITSVVLIYKTEQRQANVKTDNSGQSSADVNYDVFNLEKLKGLREQGVPVFVNMTAAWCITCLANEKVALSSNELKNYFKGNNIAYLKGDWTNQDPVITQFLKSFGRSSVPIYVYYPPNSDVEPIVLPQILTAATVIDSIESANALAQNLSN